MRDGRAQRDGRGAILGTVTVTAVEGQAAPAAGATGVISAEPNPCRAEPGRVNCAVHISWSSTGEHARIFVRSEGSQASPEREFATGRSGDRVRADWIAPDTRYIFTLVDFSGENRGQELARVVVSQQR